MTFEVRKQVLRMSGFALAGAGSTAVALGSSALLAPGLGAGAVWIAAGAVTAGPAGALAAALPALALAGGSWWALAGWTIAGTAAALTWSLRPTDERVLSAREAVRDADRDRRLLGRHLDRWPQLLETCLELSSARDHTQLAGTLCARVRALLDGVQQVKVFLGEDDEPACVASSDAVGQPCPSAAGSDERYVAGESRPLVRRDHGLLHALLPLRGDRRRDDGGEGPRGVLVVVVRPADRSGDLELELLGALARLAGIGIAAVDLLQRTRGLALRDALTGLYGQHEFLRRLEEAAAAAQRKRSSLGVLMCDMDRLKVYNDTHGHPSGDAALRSVARALIAAMPPEAIPCRYGGEEFAALWPGATRENLAQLAEKVRASIAGCTPEATHPERTVTASIGFALLGHGESGRACLTRADQACYQAKAGGRNRVEAAP